MPSAENMELIRKQKRSALQLSAWEARRPIIQKLYLTEKRPLKKVIEIMREENNFNVTKAQYETWFAKWGFRKHLSDNDWIFIYRQIEKRKRQRKCTSIYLNNSLVPNQKIKNELARHVLPSQEHALASRLEISEETPEGIFVCTPAIIALDGIRLDNLPWFQFKGFDHSQIIFDQRPEFLVDQPRDYWTDLENHTIPSRLNSEYDIGWSLSDTPTYASDVRPITERSLWNMQSIFLNLPRDAEPSSTNYYSNMIDLLPQLEINIPDFPTGQFKENWDTLAWSSHADTVHNFLEYVVYLSSNNMLEDHQTSAVLQWLTKSGNQPALNALISGKLPTALACIHNVFRHALNSGNLEVARALIATNIDFSEVLQSSKDALWNAVMRGNVKLFQFLVQKGVNIDLSDNLLRVVRSVEIAQLLLQASKDFDGAGYPRKYLSEALRLAIRRHDLSMAEFWVREGADVNLEDREGTLLNVAVETRDVRFVELLLVAGAEVDAPGGGRVVYHSPMGGFRTISHEKRVTPLQVAAACDSLTIATHLLRAGANANAPGDEMGALHWAVKRGSVEMVRLLLAYSADPNMTANNKYRSTVIQLAAERGRTDLIQVLLAAGATVENSADLCLLRAQLRQAIWEGCIDKARATLQLGVNVNMPFSDDTTAIQDAIDRDNVGMVQLLVEAGADVNMSCRDRRLDESMMTPLEFALQLDSTISETLRPNAVQIAKILLNNGASPNPNGFAALQQAVKIGDLDLIRFLLKHGADINSPATPNKRRTALQQAVNMVEKALRFWAGNVREEARLEVVEFLMKEGANINAPPAESFGRTALQAAASANRGSIKLIQYLIDAGADVNAPAAPRYGLTALQGAAIQGHIKFARMLLDQNADVNAPGAREEGRTALEGAAEHGRLDMVQLLINAGADSHLPGRQRYRGAAKYAAKEGHIVIANLLRARFEN